MPVNHGMAIRANYDKVIERGLSSIQRSSFKGKLVMNLRKFHPD